MPSNSRGFEITPITPHRKEHSREPPCQGDDRHAPAATMANRARPLAKRPRISMRRSPHPPGRLHEQGLHSGVRRSNHAAAALLLARAVLTGHQAKIAGYLTWSAEARDVIKRRDKRDGGDGTDPRQRHQSANHWVTVRQLGQ